MKNAKGWILYAFNLTILEKNRYSWVDYLRGVIILLVVYHHAYLGIERSGIPVPETVGKANMIFYSFRMPLFFIISGVFTTISLSKQSVKDLIFVKFDKILYPYFIWAFIQVTLQIFMSHFTNSDRTVHDYLYILYQPKQLDQFWYLPALFNATMVFIFFKTKVKPSRWVHLIIGLVLFTCAPFLNDISMMSNWMRFYLFFVIGDLISGMLFTEIVQQQLKKPITLLIFLPVFIGAQIVYLHNNVGAKAMETTIETFHGNSTLYALNELNFLFTSLIGCITLIIMAFLLEKWNKLSFLRVIGFHSLYIYMIHVIVVGLVRSILIHFLHLTNPILILLTVIAFGVAIPIMFYNLLGRTYLWFLFTTRKKKRIEEITRQVRTIQPLTQAHSQPKPDIRST
jgi:fucose 4-O-acetylase-like acetyltransferase